MGKKGKWSAKVIARKAAGGSGALAHREVGASTKMTASLPSSELSLVTPKSKLLRNNGSKKTNASRTKVVGLSSLGYEADIFGPSVYIPAVLSTFHLLSTRSTTSQTHTLLDHRQSITAPTHSLIQEYEWADRILPPPGPIAPPSWKSRSHYSALHRNSITEDTSTLVHNPNPLTRQKNTGTYTRTPSHPVTGLLPPLPLETVSDGPLSLSACAIKSTYLPAGDFRSRTPPSLMSISLHCLFTAGIKRARSKHERSTDCKKSMPPYPLSYITQQVPPHIKQLILYYYPFYYDVQDRWLLPYWRDSTIRYFNFSNSTRLSLNALRQLFNPPIYLNHTVQYRRNSPVDFLTEDNYDNWEMDADNSDNCNHDNCIVESPTISGVCSVEPLSLDISYTKLEVNPSALVVALFADNINEDCANDEGINTREHRDMRHKLLRFCPTSSLSRHLLHLNISGLFNAISGPVFLQSLSCYAVQLRVLECNNTFWITALDVLCSLPWTRRQVRRSYTQPNELASNTHYFNQQSTMSSSIIPDFIQNNNKSDNGWNDNDQQQIAYLTPPSATLLFFPYLRLLHCTGSVVCPLHKRQLREVMKELRPTLALVV